MSVDPNQLAQLISDRFVCEFDDVIESSTLFSGGLLDSFNLVELITELESSYSIRIKATEVNLGNFDSVKSIADLVARKVSG